jgi:endoglucanase
LWAAAELWETTGSPEVLRDLETRIRAVHGQFNFEFDWDEVKNLGLMKYLSSQRPGRDPALVALVRSNLLALADETVQNCRQHGYASPIGSLYSWGYNGFVARQTMILMAADRLTRHTPGTVPHLAGTIQLERVNTVWRAWGDEPNTSLRASTGGGPNGAPAN